MTSKTELRARVRAQRLARGERTTAALGDAVTAQLLTLVQGVDARTVACFAATKLEPPTFGFRQAAREARIRVLLPRVVSETEMSWHIDTDEWDTPGTFGLPAPLGPHAEGGLDSAELIIIPAAAVDRSGHRLGWGRGYFDRALAVLAPQQRRRIVALVHDDEVWDALPHDAHDIPVSGVVTPTRYFDTSERI